MAAETLLDGEAEALTRKAVEMALEGDSTALRLCLERILPARRDRPVSFKMPVLKSASDAVSAASVLLEETAAGNLTPLEAEALARLVTCYTATLEAKEFEERLSALENAKQ